MVLTYHFIPLFPHPPKPEGGVSAHLKEEGWAHTGGHLCHTASWQYIQACLPQPLPHSAAGCRFDRAIHGPIALRCGGANGLRQHTPRQTIKMPVHQNNQVDSYTTFCIPYHTTPKTIKIYFKYYIPVNREHCRSHTV